MPDTAALTISVDTKRVRDDIRLKSHLQTKMIPDPEARDAARADIEKLDEINRDLLDARADLVEILNPFLLPDESDDSNDAIVLTGDDAVSFDFEFDITSRRLRNRARPLADAMHAYLVDNVLRRFYFSVAQGELANIEAAQLESDRQALEKLLYTKLHPVYQTS